MEQRVIYRESTRKKENITEWNRTERKRILAVVTAYARTNAWKAARY
jgi:hypothetical protein